MSFTNYLSRDKESKLPNLLCDASISLILKLEGRARREKLQFLLIEIGTKSHK